MGRILASFPKRHPLATVLVLPVVAAAIYLVVMLVVSWQLAHLQAPRASVILLDRYDRYLATVHDPGDPFDQGRESHRGSGYRGYGYWPLQSLPKRVEQATLALEDKRFWSHWGIDARAVARAFAANYRAGRTVQGASTITMQVARMQHPGARRYHAKFREALTALWLTIRYDREAILKHYLRLVPYGNQTHGIAYAAQYYFDKPVDDLSWAEIAFLSAVPQAPTWMNPRRAEGAKRAKARARRILGYLRDRRVIERGDYELAMVQLDKLRIHAVPVRHRDSMHAVMRLKDMLYRDHGFLHDARDPKRPYRIRTTLNSHLQSRLQQLAFKAMARWRDKGLSNLAAIVVKRENMQVLAWQGSQNYFDDDAGAMDFTRIPRSPGSTLKPFIYAYALDREIITPASLLDDMQDTAVGFRNADHRFLGPLLPRHALANSRNVPAVALMEKVGLQRGYDFLRLLNLHDQSQPAEFYGLGMSIGAMPTTLERLVTAYGVFTNDGVLKPLRWTPGSEVAGNRLLKTATARQISLFLSDPMARLPSFPRMGSVEYAFPVAIKTGTSQGYRDTWTVAYSRDYLVAVWMGRHDLRAMKELTGAGSAAVLAQDIMLSLQDDRQGLADLKFDPPPGYKAVSLCVYTGKRAPIGEARNRGNACDRTMTEYFPPHQIPALEDQFQTVAIDDRNGLLAGAWTPRQHVKMQRMVSLNGKYKAWARANQLAFKPLRSSALNRPVNSRPDLRQALKRAFKDGQIVRLHIKTPYDREHIIRNPELPAQWNSLALRVEVDPPVEQVVWFVDDQPFQVVEPPYTARWPLQPGRHRLQVKLPYRGEQSKVVEVEVY